MPSKDDELGALWAKSSAHGDYMTGTICGQRVVVFPNKYKNADKQPDWKVYRSRPREEESA